MRRFNHWLSASASALFILTSILVSCGSPTGPGDPGFRLSVMSLHFPSGESDREVTITNLLDEPVDWRVMGTTASWLSATPSVGSLAPRASGTFAVRVNRNSLSLGSHLAVVQIGSQGPPLALEVAVEQGKAPEPALEPRTLHLGALDESGILEVVNSGESTMDWTLRSSAGWATAEPSNGRVPPGERRQVVVNVDRRMFPQGSYFATLTLSSNGGEAKATVNMQVGAGAGIHLEPGSLHFGLSSNQLPLRIQNNGTTSLAWSATPGAPWMSLSSRSGTVPPMSSGTIGVSVSRSGLPHGLHQAALRFTSNAGSAAATISLNAAPSGSTPTTPTGPAGIGVTPVALDFGASETELSLLVLNEGDEHLEWSVTPKVSWITVSPSTGRVSPHTDATLRVNVARSGLTVGSYQSVLDFESNGGTASARVQMQVAPPTPLPPGPSPGPDLEPAQLSVTPTAVDFGESATQLTARVRNTGGTTLNWTAQPANGWLTLNVSSGTLTAGASVDVIVRASRASLSAAGAYQGSVVFSSNGGSATTRVSLRVPSSSTTPPPDPSDLSAIDPTGTKDVTVQLNQYIASIPDGSVIRLPAGARYRAEGVVRILERHNLTIEGNGALIFATTDGFGVTPPEDLRHLWPRQRSHVEVRGGSNIVIRNLKVRGANPTAGAAEGAFYVDLEGQHGFDIRGVNGLLLERVTVTDTYGDLLYLGNMPRTGWSNNVIVRQSRFERSGRQGIAITGAQNVEISDNYVGEVGRSVIDIEPATPTLGARNVLITRNTFGPCRHLLLSAGGRGPNVSDISFIGNRAIDIGLKIRVAASDGARRGSFRILDNRSEVQLGMPVAALRFHRVDGVEVRNNYQLMAPKRDMTGVGICDGTAIDVRDNEFPNALEELNVKPVCLEESDDEDSTSQ